MLIPKIAANIRRDENHRVPAFGYTTKYTEVFMFFWFIVGAQHLYGQKALDEVKLHAGKMVDGLNSSNLLPYPIVLKEELAVSAESITKIMKEVNYNDEVAGVITWMHTFSPAKMWIRGTSLLQKPLLHLATQFNETIPWQTIDMDFMNLNQSAHGDREYGFINARLGKNNTIVSGFWQSDEVQKEIADWMNVAVAYQHSFQIKVARFGDNMRDVAVTDGDKIEAQIQFGWTVDYFGIGDLVEEIRQVSDDKVDALFDEYAKQYDFDYADYKKEDWENAVKEQARYEIALKSFLDRGGYNAFTTNFQDLHGMNQLPGLAVQRLMGMGYGFAGEGDWKTAALDRLLKIMTHNRATGFMEDYTYEMTENNAYVLGSHMLEVDPTLSASKAKILVSPLGIGGKADPARLVFDGMAGEGIIVTLSDFGKHFKLIINEVTAFEPTSPAPKLPVARVLWKIKPDFRTGIRRWIEEGGGHHTVISLTATTKQLTTYARMVGLDYVIIS